MNLKITKPRVPTMSCPHCNARCIARSSSELTPLYRELHYRCDNDACGHTFVAGLEILRTVAPSLNPNPEVRLPFANRPRPGRHANDDQPIVVPAPANDDAMSGTG